ncbi:4a-hydroxytetrahydrobiopterin dehydratase [Antrihabitans sp. YC2-6]|uniref:4a-hydroxytetrahydrobiopterin dehydratase n=1 Tax=Antrihabitans sp. YC2-6 TaxID=2799498 RepID=UPI0018F6E588|nr:4a-hydroxytetrahydrobiopterin dehydratase [Antrihabitans sp. YC2-6]MBJ8343667.1 4a-hydroxytetrahydrobiopterin dehydratase [Antrihabitans sp. YC2-6]
MATLLSDSEITDALTGLPDWTKADKAITRTFERPSFLDGIEFVRRVGEAAESANHHPDIDIRWRKVTLTLSTHSEGGITDLDVSLAQTVDRLA